MVYGRKGVMYWILIIYRPFGGWRTRKGMSMLDG